MRLSGILREGALNVVSGVTRTGVMTLVFALAIGALACAEIGSVTSIEQQARRFQTAGGTPTIYKAPGRINGARCDALRSVEGVKAAGGGSSINCRLHSAGAAEHNNPDF